MSYNSPPAGPYGPDHGNRPPRPRPPQGGSGYGQPPGPGYQQGPGHGGPWAQPQQGHQAGYAAPLPPRPPKRRRWPLILGGFILAFVVMIGGCMAVVGGTAASIASSAGGGPANISYEIEGDGTAMAVTWSTPSGVSQESSTSLPWSTEVAWQDTFAAAFTVSAGRDGMGDSGPITCRITNTDTGDVLAENTSNGEFANVSCDAFAGG